MGLLAEDRLLLEKAFVVRTRSRVHRGGGDDVGHCLSEALCRRSITINIASHLDSKSDQLSLIQNSCYGDV